MNLTPSQRSGLKTMLIVGFLLIIAAYLFVSLIFKMQLLMSPCELCVESQPYLKQCFVDQMNFNTIVPGGINFSDMGFT